jgi:hypothetical protein
VEAVAARLLVGSLLVLLVLAGWVAYRAWGLHPELTMPAEGYAAMWIGIVFSLVVGCGLMALVFYSSRRGYDEPPETIDDKDRDGPST